jgi:hypothetical protein
MVDRSWRLVTGSLPAHAYALLVVDNLTIARRLIDEPH